ncbi:hypothetical protein WG922_21635 [Ramlibacter sp. AN1015]|uniref:hypothetical protein n=1 Tax=Ramlibacter sp. AN1015 TaxID=3133428 RepID=UPI0030C38147
MPVARFQMPDGRIARFEVPEGTTPEQAQAMISQTLASEKAEPSAPSFGQMLKSEALNSVPAQAALGALRGAGSIGATLVDAARGLGDAVMSATPEAMRPTATAGLADLPRGQEIRSGMDAGLTQMGANPDALAFQGGKIGAEIAGTSGVGAGLAKGLAAIPGFSRAPALLESIRTGGMSVGGATGAGGLALRAAGGATFGGASAGLIDPESAKTGAVLGAAIPVAGKVVGASAEKIGSALHGKPAMPNSQLVDSAREAIEAGYTIPPATVKPTFVNRMLESTSGKMATQQLASAKNQDVTQSLIRKSLGLADDAPINLATLDAIRKDAGKAYQAIADLPAVPAQRAQPLMNQPAQAAIKPRQLVEELKQARNDAQSWFKSYNASANPEHLTKAKAAEALSNQIEDTLEKYAQSLNVGELLPALREARKRIAQTYTVERALNEATGSIDARVFGKLFQKGKPLSGGMEKVGRFGAAFPTVAKLPEQVGSPDVHNLRAMASLLMGSGGLGVAGPVGMLAGAMPYAAPPLARSIMFSNAAQRGLLAPMQQQGPGLLANSVSRSVPVLIAQ